MWLRYVNFAFEVGFGLAAFVKRTVIIPKHIYATIFLDGRAYVPLMISCAGANIVLGSYQELGHFVSA